MTATTSDDVRYVSLHRLARGGMAEVHLAQRHDAEGNRDLVALKRILPRFADDPAFARMFLNETRLSSLLEHPHIARVLDFGRLSGRSFLAMEYVHGTNLGAVLERAGAELCGGVMPLEASLWIAIAVGEALDHAHLLRDSNHRSLGIVHRDVSPSNLLLGFDGQVKLADFGLAKATEASSETASHALKGNQRYLSPEQAQGKQVDRRTDIFSLGVVLFEMTTGYRQFTGSSEFVLLNTIAEGHIIAPSRVDARYPAELERIVLQAMCPDPDQRYQDVADLVSDLRAFADRHGLSPSAAACAELVCTLFDPPPPPAIPATPDEVLIPSPQDRTVIDPSPPPPTWARAMTIAVTVALVVAVTAIAFVLNALP